MPQETKYRELTDEEVRKLNLFLNKKKLENIEYRTVRGSFYEFHPPSSGERRRPDSFLYESIPTFGLGWYWNKRPAKKNKKGQFTQK